MDNLGLSHIDERSPTRRHTFDTSIQANATRYDFILPSYTRDRRAASVSIPNHPERIIEEQTTTVNLSTNQTDSSSNQETENCQGSIC